MLNILSLCQYLHFLRYINRAAEYVRRVPFYPVTYGTGKQHFVGQLALVNFDNAEGLIPVGNNAFAASMASGTESSPNGVQVGRAGNGIMGDIKAKALESSNVDMASELVRLMVLQRSYSASSQTMRAYDQALRDVIQMVS